MIAVNTISKINASVCVGRVNRAANTGDSTTFHGEEAKRPTHIMANKAGTPEAESFRYDTPAMSSGFAAQAIAQALRLPRVTPLEGAREYGREPSTRLRLIRFA
jgi:hypothetical protein